MKARNNTREKGQFKRKLKQFFKKVKEFFQDLGNGINDFIREVVRPAVDFLQIVKTALDNPNIDIFTAATASGFDNKLVERLRIILPVVIRKLGLVVAAGDLLNNQRTINAYLSALKNQSPSLRSATIHKTAALIAKELNGSEYTSAEIDTLTQITYNELKEETSA
jgi:hypothetical protein